jgi:DNA-binding NarL/FixJ family response regulator
MAFVSTVVSVMIASPSDVSEERSAARRIIEEWNVVHAQERKTVLLSVGWESHVSPTLGDRPQAIINKQALDKCDLLVAIFWTRLGTPTGKESSGTVEEIGRHVSAGKPALIYFSDAPLPPSATDRRQYEALRVFQDECLKAGIVQKYNSVADFEAKFSRHLAQTILREFSRDQAETNPEASHLASSQSPNSLTEQEVALLKAAAKGDGIVVISRTIGGTNFSAGNVRFGDRGDGRSEAIWEEAIGRLLQMGFLTEPNRDFFRLTASGYRAADRMK